MVNLATNIVLFMLFFSKTTLLCAAAPTTQFSELDEEGGTKAHLLDVDMEEHQVFIPGAEAVPIITRLFQIVARGEIEDLKDLLAREKDVTRSRNMLGETIFMTAAKYGQEKIMHLLFLYELDVEALDRSGKNALIHAASGIHDPGLVPLILTKRPRIDTQDNCRRTALMYAVSHNNINAARALLAAGASKKLKDVDGLSVYDLATGNKAMHRLLSTPSCRGCLIS